PALMGAAAPNVLSLLVLGHCLGRDRWTACAVDALWRDLLRIPPQATLDDFSVWLDEVGSERLRVLMDALVNTADILAPDLADLADLVDASGNVPAPWRTPLAAAAWYTLRRFARRLPGFHAASVGYLWRNFLDIGARLEVEPDRIVVTISRP